MAYTNIPKPVSTSYTNVGKASGDIPLYGTAIYGTDTYGISDNYTKVSKPNGFGLYTWDGMNMTWDNADGIWGENNTGYTNISKPT